MVSAIMMIVRMVVRCSAKTERLTGGDRELN